MQKDDKVVANPSKYILKQIDHDNLENHDPIVVDVLDIFVDGESTAYKQASEYIANIGPKKFYLGYDYKVYPQFKMEKV